MYADYYGLQESPFSLTPDTSYFFLHQGQLEALNVLRVALQQGEGLLKVVGEVGTGKTLLCRKLLNLLGAGFYTAYLPNPALAPTVLRKALAKELGIDVSVVSDQHWLTERINERLIELAGEGNRVVLLVDEAQAIPEESLEALRLLTNLETEKAKLLQIVLFGQPELDDKLSHPSLRQVKQRIAFSYRLQPMAMDEIEGYISHRLVVAGYQGKPLFFNPALRAIYRSSQGVPRLINLICNKALLLAYGKGDHVVRKRYVREAVSDTEGAVRARRSWLGWSIALTVALCSLAGSYLLGVLP
ncbi:MAG: AAA family ATPase [Gammaproteobacteria bacterium]|nr:AAA family ATPase [Gammaproteobacteria bacterium]